MPTPLDGNAHRSAHPFVALARRILRWPGRVLAARQTLHALAGLSDAELKDIGLSRQDVMDSTALPLDADPSLLLVRRRAGRAGSPPRFGRAA